MEKTAQRGQVKSAISDKKPGAPRAAGKGKNGAAAASSSPKVHDYRSRTCGSLRKEDAGKTVRLSGWVHRVRDHGGLLFIDLRDHYGLMQCVADPSDDYPDAGHSASL